MRDKLAEVIRKARKDWFDDLGPSVTQNQFVAYAALAWLREYLGSDEVVDRATLAAVNWDQARMDMPTLGSVDEFRRDADRAFYTGQIRAALSSILSEPYETSGWSEVAE